MLFRSVCDICHYSRHRKIPFHLSVNKANKCYEMFHFDIWGLVSIPSIHGHKYFITALDDYSHFTWIILCKSKSEVPNHVQNFIIMIEKTSLIAKLKLLGQIMVLNSLCQTSSLLKALSTKQVVLRLPNRMGELRERINTF